MSRLNRYWCFTIPNPEGMIDIEHIKECRYIIYQHELSNETFLPHFQGYVEFKNPISMKSCKKRIDMEGHYEPRRGTQEQAIEYCRKEDTRIDGPYEWGSPSPGQGARTDLTAIRDMILEGKSDLEVANEHFGNFLRYNRGIMLYRRLATSQRDWKTVVTVCYGLPGTGKSSYVKEKAGPFAYWKPRSNWWCGYEGNAEVVMDDFYGWLPFDFLLRLLDAYPLLVETKGGQAQFLARRIWITSNKLPDEWYSEDGRFDMNALKRRIDRILVFRAIGMAPEEYLISSVAQYDEFKTMLLPMATAMWEDNIDMEEVLGPRTRLFDEPARSDQGNTSLVTTEVISDQDYDYYDGSLVATQQETPATPQPEVHPLQEGSQTLPFVISDNEDN